MNDLVADICERSGSSESIFKASALNIVSVVLWCFGVTLRLMSSFSSGVVSEVDRSGDKFLIDDLALPLLPLGLIGWFTSRASRKASNVLVEYQSVSSLSAESRSIILCHCES